MFIGLSCFRADAELTHSKRCASIAQKITKLAHNTFGCVKFARSEQIKVGFCCKLRVTCRSVGSALSVLAAEMESKSERHKHTASTFSEDIYKPLKKFADAQAKDRKPVRRAPSIVSRCICACTFM